MVTPPPARRTPVRRILAAILAALLLPVWLAVFAQLLPARPRATVVPRAGCGFLLFSPDGKRLVTVGAASFGTHCGPLQVWDVLSGGELLSVAEAWGEIETIDFSPDSRLLAAHQKEGDLKLWEIASGEEVFSRRPATEFGNWVNVRFSPDGRYLLVQEYEGDWQKVDRVRFWDLAARRERARVEASFWALEFTGRGEGLIAWRRKDGGEVVKVQRWRCTGGETLLCPAGEFAVSADEVALSPDRQTLAAARDPRAPGRPGEIELRDAESGTVRLRFPASFPGKHVQSVEFSPDGRVLAVHAGGGTQLSWETETRLWDVGGKGGPRELGSFAAGPAFSPDGKWVGVPSEDGAVLHDVSSLCVVGTLERPGDRGPSRFGSYNGLKEYPTVRFSPDSRLVAVTGLFDDRERGPLVDWLSRNIPRFPAQARGNVVRVWDVGTGQERASFPGCRELVFSPEGRTLATLGLPGTVDLWDVPVRGPAWLVAGLSLVLWLVTVVCWLGLRRRGRGRQEQEPEAGGAGLPAALPRVAREELDAMDRFESGLES